MAARDGAAHASGGAAAPGVAHAHGTGQASGGAHAPGAGQASGAAQAPGQLGGKSRAEIGADQQLFQLFERAVADVGPADDGADALAQALRRAREPGLQPLQPAAFAHAASPRSVSPSLPASRTRRIAPAAGAADVRRTGA